MRGSPLAGPALDAPSAFAGPSAFDAEASVRGASTAPTTPPKGAGGGTGTGSISEMIRAISAVVITALWGSRRA